MDLSAGKKYNVEEKKYGVPILYFKCCSSSNNVVAITNYDCSNKGIDLKNKVYLEMLHYLRSIKRTYKSFVNGNQITPDFRTKIINWLINVIKKLRLSEDTLFQTIKIMDAYFWYQTKAGHCINKSQLQLIGVSCLFLANKYNDYRNLTADYIERSLVNGAYHEEQILECEKLIFQTIEESLGIPYELTFIGLYTLLLQYDLYPYADQFIEQAEKNLHSYVLAQMDPEELALGSMYIAMHNDPEMVLRLSTLSDRSIELIIHYAASIKEQMYYLKMSE